VTARKMVDLKVADAPLAGVDQVELVARAIQAPELVASATDALVALPEQHDAGDGERAAERRSVG
jgi:DNA recombination protein RmuC